MTSLEARVFEEDRLIFVFLVVGTAFAKFVDPEQILELKEESRGNCSWARQVMDRMSNPIAVRAADYERKSV